MKFSASKVATRIGVPVSRWPSNCHYIATKMIQADLVPGGRVTRGLWVGPIAEGNVFSGRAFTGHSWVETPDGTIVDPTRWVFNNEPPGVYVGPNDGNYDKGGNLVRRSMRQPFPEFDPATAEYLDASLPALEHLANIIYASTGELRETLSEFSKEQLFWICNLSPDELGEHAFEIYSALGEMGWKAGIPMDNWDVVMGDD